MDSTRQTIVITGASDGIGAAAARILRKRGCDVIMVGRSAEKTKVIASELNVPYYLADFSVLRQVKELVRALRADHPHIDVFVNNAGGIMGEREVTIDGFERTFQVNYLAPFLLTQLLLPTFINSKTTIIQTASIAAKRYADIDINDLQNENAYTAQKAYGDAKLANILFTRELQRRYGKQGIAAVAYHPGIVGTNFARDTTHFMRYLYHTPVLRKLFSISPVRGTDTLLWLIDGVPRAAWAPGEYYEKKRVAKSHPLASDRALAKELWERSVSLLHSAGALQ